MTSLDRRTFLTRGAAVLGAAGIGGALATDHDGAARAGETADAGRGEDVSALAYRATQAELNSLIPFSGARQAGILEKRQAQATFVALDSLAPDAATLGEALQALSHRARELTVGGAIPVLELDAPPADSGILGPVNAPDDLTVTIGLGASLFDDRYGLTERRPPELTEMPTFATDELDPAQSHGDVLLQICANERDTVVHTVRELVRTVRGALQVRWMVDGFQGASRGPTPRSNGRNLFGFRDGTSNPDVDDIAQMARLTWVGDSNPAWATGGTYMIVRLIRQHVEFWDRVGLNEQQTMIGRDRSSGAPLGGTDEFQDPDYPSDPHGERIPLTAHIRLANPRTKATDDQRMLRRSYNYTRGYDEAGQLDQGLIFVAFNQSPNRQFVTTQTRLMNEPMVDYITPIGGGYVFAPAGAQTEADWVGSGLFAKASSA
jgi:deferrochelatase/peroxidase EfeB